MAEPTGPGLGSGDPPHSVLDPTTFPKVYARDQPMGQQETFQKFYPNGLPIVYNMSRNNSDSPSDVADKYLENYLPLDLYTNPPPNARAIFSTVNGQRAVRKLEHAVPQRKIHLWTRDELQSVCNSIRKVFWVFMRRIQQPFSWEDLWCYFDAHDIYHYGALNLWNVINHLHDENKIIFDDMQKEFALHIGQWADDWLLQPGSRKKLQEWDEDKGPIFSMMTNEDLKSLGKIKDDVIPLIANALKSRREILLAKGTSREQTRPVDLVTACRTNSMESWLGESLDE